MKSQFETEIKVGIFVAVGVALLMIAILMLGGADRFFTRSVPFVTYFDKVDGLVDGAKVTLGGLPVGTVQQISFETETGRIRVAFQIPEKYAPWVRKDTEVEILTQGVLGDKFLALNAGTKAAEALAAGSEIPARPTKDLSQVLTKSDKLIVSLNSIAGSLESILGNFDRETRRGDLFRNLSTTARELSIASARMNQELEGLKLQAASRHLSSILQKIDNGTGTLGALVNDPGLYDDTKALMGGANRNRIIRNLVRKTIKEGDQAEAQQPGQDQAGHAK